MNRILTAVMSVLILITIITPTLKSQELYATDDSMDGEFSGAVGGKLGFRQYKGADGIIQNFAVISIAPEFMFGKFGLGLQADLQFDDDGIREEDWDETRDYFNIIRFLRYGKRRKDPFAVRVGVIHAGTLGHGILVNRYFSDIDLNKKKVGGEAWLDLGIVGLEGFTNTVYQPEVIGSRIFIRPLKILLSDSYFSKLTFGASYVTDRDAPVSLRADVDSTGSPRLDSFGNLIIETDTERNILFNRDKVIAYAGDIEFPLYESDLLSTLFYADWARLKAPDLTSQGISQVRREAKGFSAGVDNEFHVGLIGFIDFKLERRDFGSGFIPTYFDTFYDVERFQTRAREDSTLTGPKAALIGSTTTQRQQGAYAELFVGLVGIVKLGGTYEDYSGANNTKIELRGELSAPKTVPIRLHAEYFKRNFETKSLSNIFTFDNRSLFRGTLEYRMLPYLWIGGTFTRAWLLDTNTGRYVSANSWSPSVNLYLTF